MTVGNHKSLIPFQKRILLSNNSSIELYQYVHSEYNLEYILTCILNQDILENFFSNIRGMGATNNHPTPMDVKYKLRWYILGKHSLVVFSMNKNTDESNETCLLEPLQKENGHKHIGDVNMEICISRKFFSNVLLE
jgi:hypothetical protein